MSVALVSNLTFPINGRDYGSEDRLLAEQLRSRGLEVQLVLPETLLPLSAPLNAGQLESQANLLMNVEAIFCRNNYGGLLEKEYRAALDAFYCGHEQRGKVFNDLSGKGDYRGKQHLLDLFDAGYPVIPSTVNVNDLDTREPFSTAATAGSLFMVKSMTGADSNGIKKDLTADQVRQEFLKMEAAAKGGDSAGGSFVIPDPLLQPMVEFEYEVSFFFFEGEFMYAMYNGEGSNEGSDGASIDTPTVDADAGAPPLPDASDTANRWSLRVYQPTPADMAFALKFVQWNSCSRQIQRVDACRVLCSSPGESRWGSGVLLLMEIEDYNCWLSLGDLQEQRPELFECFMDRIAASLQAFISAKAD